MHRCAVLSSEKMVNEKPKKFISKIVSMDGRYAQIVLERQFSLLYTKLD